MLGGDRIPVVFAFTVPGGGGVNGWADKGLELGGAGEGSGTDGTVLTGPAAVDDTAGAAAGAVAGVGPATLCGTSSGLLPELVGFPEGLCSDELEPKGGWKGCEVE